MKKISDVPFAILRLQYRAARVPLQIVEEQVVARLDNESPARLVYERSLGALDVTVGNLLGDPKIAERGGAALAERSEHCALRPNSMPRPGGPKCATPARSSSSSGRGQPAAPKKRPRDKAEKNHAGVSAASRGAQAVGRQECGRPSVSCQGAGRQVAAQRTAAVENAKQTEQASIGAAEKTVTKAAQAKLEDAQDRRSEAASIRNDADRVNKLADVEKEKRQEARAAEKNGSS